VDTDCFRFRDAERKKLHVIASISACVYLLVPEMEMIPYIKQFAYICLRKQDKYLI